MLIYLAGCMTYHINNGYFDLALNWRKEAQKGLELCGFHVFNPMSNFLNNYNLIKDQTKAIVKQNLVYLKKTDVLLVNLDGLQYSPGTMFEIFFAYLHNIPVIAFGNDPFQEQPHIKESITYQCKDLEQAITLIINLFEE